MAEIDLDLGPDQIYQAIREGVADAMWRLMTNATDMPCNDFYDHVKAGVKDAVLEMGAVPDDG